MIKVVTVVGARPQFIKAAAVSRAFGRYRGAHIKEILVHTGQHYDDNMSKVFFDELDMPFHASKREIPSPDRGSMTFQVGN